MSLHTLCEVARVCSYTKVVDLEKQQIIHMDLGNYTKRLIKGGTIRAVYTISPILQVKVYVFSCRRNITALPCKACMNKSHHKCTKPVYLHVLVRIQ